MAVFLDGRKERILYELENYGKVSVKDLAEKFEVTTETIRRDLDALESEMKLKRVHGGAIKISFDKTEPSYVARRDMFREDKQRIGKAAAEMISDNDVIAIDAGTTTCEILYHLRDKKNITVVLNNIAGLNILIDLKNRKIFDGRIIFLGGEINSEQFTCFGPVSEKSLKDFYIDKAFVAVGGMSLQSGLTGYDINEANLSRRIMDHSKENIVVADKSKIGVRNFYKVSDMSCVDMVVCSEEAPGEWKEKLEEMELKWIRA